MKINRKVFLKSLGISAVGTLTGTYYSNSSESTGITFQESTGTIPKRRLGKKNLMASVLCIGAGSRFTDDSFIPVGEREEYLRYALSHGVNYIDTAINYADSEKILGDIFNSDDWSNLILSSKTNSKTYDGVMRDFETSIKNLKRDNLDSYLLHNSGLADNVEGNRPTFSALLELREQGLVGNIGFSSHGAVSLPVAVNLVKEYDLDHLVLNVGEERVDYRPVVPDILVTGCTVSAIKVTRIFEGKGPVESARLAFNDVLSRSFTAAIISHSNAGIGDRGWKKVLDENIKTARMFA